MKRLLTNTIVGIVVVLSIVGATNTLMPLSAQAASCSTSFFGLPNWWRGLAKTSTVNNQPVCVVNLTASKDGTWQTGVLTIAINVLDALLRLSGMVAVVFIVWGGIQYIISQGEAGSGSSPGGVVKAKQTIMRAISGLVIAILAVFILNFVAGTIFHLTVNPDNYHVCTNGGSCT